MRRLLFIIIGLLGLVACKTDKTPVPQDFECFNQPRVFIKYKQPINGYTVKVMCMPCLLYTMNVMTKKEKLKYGVAHCYALKKNIVGSMFIMKVSPIAFSTMSIKSRSKMGWF